MIKKDHNHYVNMKLENDNLFTKVDEKINYLDFYAIKILRFDLNVVHNLFFRNVFMNGLNIIERLCSGVNDLIGEIIKWNN